MKNIFLVLSILTVLFSCDNPNVHNDISGAHWNSKTPQLDEGVTIQKYKGHSYIFFKEGYRMGVVHNPDCNCNKHN